MHVNPWKSDTSIHEQTMFERNVTRKINVRQTMHVNPISKGTTWRDKDKTNQGTPNQSAKERALKNHCTNNVWNEKRLKESRLDKSKHAKPISKGMTWVNKDKPIMKLKNHDLKNKCTRLEKTMQVKQGHNTNIVENEDKQIKIVTHSKPACTVPRRLWKVTISPRRNDSPPGSTPFNKSRRHEPKPNLPR